MSPSSERHARSRDPRDTDRTDPGGGSHDETGAVAAELEWTATKTSHVVTGLRDDGSLNGCRLGRENGLSPPDARGDDSADAGP